MDVRDAIRQRRSVREFQEKAISEYAVEALTEAVIWAPSAGNLQARKFHFIFDREIKLRVAEACLNQMFIASAPLVVVACGDYGKIRHYGARGRELYVIQDTAVAVENLMLQACGLGLGSVWVGAFDEEELKAVLELPDTLRPMSVIPVGYPAHVPSPTQRDSKDGLISFIR